MIRLTRRELVQRLAGVGALALLTAFSRIGDDAFAAALLPPSGEPPSRDVFHALSMLVTCHDDLDRSVSDRLYPVFMEEPWGPKHIATAYAVIHAAVPPDGLTCEPVHRVSLDTGEAWFVEHLVTTWYLGVYYHAERPTRRLLYEEALMFGPVADLLPIPLIEAVPYGDWSVPPAGQPR